MKLSKSISRFLRTMSILLVARGSAGKARPWLCAGKRCSRTITRMRMKPPRRSGPSIARIFSCCTLRAPRRRLDIGLRRRNGSRGDPATGAEGGPLLAVALYRGNGSLLDLPRYTHDNRTSLGQVIKLCYGEAALPARPSESKPMRARVLPYTRAAAVSLVSKKISASGKNMEAADRSRSRCMRFCRPLLTTWVRPRPMPILICASRTQSNITACANSSLRASIHRADSLRSGC